MISGMRTSLAVALGLASAAAVAAVVVRVGLRTSPGASREPVKERPAILRGRRAGVEAAGRDIARGTPWIRRSLDSSEEDLDIDGVGLDRETGLPLRNTTLECSTGVDWAAYRVENRAYNERILAAHAEGKLARYTLRRKLRTKADLGRLLAAPPPIRFAKDGDSATVAGGRYRFHYELKVFRDNSGESTDLFLARGEEQPRWVRLLYPSGYTARPKLLWPTGADGPLEIWIVDQETTALVRDRDRFVWVVDLPRALVVQVVGPVR